MAEALGMSSNEQTGWKKLKTPNLAMSNDPSTASSTPVSNTRVPETSQKELWEQVPRDRQLTHLEDVVVLMAWEILKIKQKVGALRCGAKFVVVLRDKNWKQQLSQVCEGWCAKQQEKDDGAAHPWSSLWVRHFVHRRHTLSREKHRIASWMVKSWIRGNGQMQTSSLGQCTWVLQTNPSQARSDAPSQFMEQFRP